MPGGGHSETVVQQPSLTPEQTALTAAQVDLAHEQLAQLQSQGAFTQQFQDAFGPIIPQEATLLQQQIDQANSPEQQQITNAQNQLTLLNLSEAQKNAPIQDQILQLQLQNLQNGGAATPQQQALVDQATRAGIASGTSDINQWVSDATKQIAQELAPQLGLRPTDQPIIDRAGQIAKEGLRQVGQLQSNLQGAAAQAKINLPLAVGQYQSGLGLAQQNLLTGQQSFADQLAQQAQANRLQLFGAAQGGVSQAGSLGLGLAGLGPNPGFYGKQGSTTSDEYTKNLGAQDYISMISQGLGAVGGAFMSSRALKDRQEAADGEAILTAIADLVVDRWHYHGEMTEHVGPYAEDFQAAFHLGNGHTIEILDAIGVLFAAVKALAQRAPVNA